MTYNQMVAPLKEYIPDIDILLWGDTYRPIISYYALCGAKLEDWIPLLEALVIVNLNQWHKWN